MAETSNLTEDQKKFIDSNVSRIPDLIELTRATFMNESLDGRTKEGRAVRAYLIEKGESFNTTKARPAKEVELTKEQENFVREYASDGVNAFQIAKLIFVDENVTPLSKETLVIADFIRSDVPEGLNSEDTARGIEYNPPSSSYAAVKKINQYAGKELTLEKLTKAEEMCIESLLKVLNSPRFVQQISSYTDLGDRNLFEAEMVRACWDKSDLTSDETNLYINVCMDYINLKQIEKQKLKLNDMFNDAEDQADLTIRLTEILKTKSEEYNQCVGRIDRVITKLQGDRSKRLSSKHRETASVLSLVRLFQDEEERKLMVKMAQMQNKLVKKEADRMESLPEWKARVLGINKRDLG
jgi:hypothetical protein